MRLPAEVEAILKMAAPTLAGALAGPLGPLAAAVTAKALDMWMFTPEDLGDEPAPPSPEQITHLIGQNANNPAFILDLKRAELDLLRYQAQAKIDFARVEQETRRDTQTFQEKSAIARPLMHWGMGIVVMTMGSLLTIVAGSLLMIAGVIRIPAETAQLAVGVFGLIGTVIGYVANYGSQIVGFYWGSSSTEKANSDRTTETLRDMGSALGEAARSMPAATAAPVVVVPSGAEARPPAPTRDVEWRRGPFGGVRWRVMPEGIIVEGDTQPERTVGEPVTVRRIWRDYGAIIQEVCAKQGVPAEVVVGVIATESRGVATAGREEPDGRVSTGVMQVLTSTAAEMLERPVTAEEMMRPEISIEAGTRYIAKQRGVTGFDPILVAAAYNAGGLYQPRQQDDNRFRLRSTGDHLERMRKYFNDAVAVAKSDNWFA